MFERNFTEYRHFDISLKFLGVLAVNCHDEFHGGASELRGSKIAYYWEMSF